MKWTQEELKHLYRHETARSVRGREDCLSPDLLLRAAAGESDQAEREGVADHLSVCSDCAQEYRLVNSAKFQADHVTSAGEEPKPGATVITVSHPKWEQKSATASAAVRIAYAVAASLLIVCLTLAGWIVTLRQENRQTIAQLNEQRQQLARQEETLAATQRSLAEARQKPPETPKPPERDEAQLAELRKTVEELSQPRINVPIIDLDPVNSLRGSGTGAPATVTLPANANLFTLILNTTGQPSHSSYGVDIMDPHGKLIWQGRGLRKSEFNAFTLALTRRMFPAGPYHIKLFGLNAGRKELVEDYSMQIQSR